MNDYHLVTALVDGKPVEQIVPGPRPVEKKAEKPKADPKAEK